MEHDAPGVLCQIASVMVVFGHLAIGHRPVDLLFANVPPARGQVGLAGTVRVDGKKRERALEILSLAGRAGRDRIVAYQKLEEVVARAARVLVKRHDRQFSLLMIHQLPARGKSCSGTRTDKMAGHHDSRSQPG